MTPTRGLLVAVLGIALLLRLAYAIALPQTLTFDEPHFEELARHLVTGRGYVLSGEAYETAVAGRPTSVPEPLYPLFLAAVYRIVGLGQHRVARIAQALVNTASVALLMLIAATFWSRRAALLVGAIAAVHIPFLYFTGLLMSENLFIFGLLAFAYCWAVAVRDDSPALYGAAGVAFGAASLTRALLLYFLLALLPLTAAVARPRWWRGALGAALLLLASAATIAPWTLRNYAVHGAVVPITTKGGYNLYFYTYPAESVDFNARFAQVPFPDMRHLNEVERDVLLRELAWQNVRERPLTVAYYAVIKVVDFWNPAAERGPWPARVAYGVAFAALLLLAVVGCGHAPEAARPLVLLSVALIVYHTLTAALFTGGGKARLVIEPLLLLLAGGGADHLLSRGRGAA